MTHINQRRDTAANWASANPILQVGEVGWETNTRKSKLGDGVTHWNDLAYTISGNAATKADVGLGNVDNTSDMDKPVSTAQAAAIAAKIVQAITNGDTTHAPSGDVVYDALALLAPLASPVFSGNPTAPTPSAGDNDTSLATTAFVNTAVGAQVQPGDFKVVASRKAPTGWLKCDGSAVSRTTYAALFAAIVPSLGAFTMTIASPGVITLANHGLSTGDTVYLTTTGALPGGLTAATNLYFVIRVDANTLRLATSRANAYAGTAVNTSGTQSGVHTMWDCPYGLGNGSTTFNLPDARGRTLAGMDVDAGIAAGRMNQSNAEGSYGNLGASGGEQSHILSVAELASHSHGLSQIKYSTTYTLTGSAVGLNASGSTVTQTTDNAGSNAGHNNVQPTLLGNVVIKT